MKQKSAFFFGIALILSSSSFAGTTVTATATTTAPAAAPALKVSGGTTEFFAIGKPSMLKIHGESSELTGEFTRKDAELTGSFEISLENFKTGMGVRDSHTKEKIFETSKYKKASLKITKLTIPGGKNGDYKAVDFSGALNFHGVEKPITGKTDLTVSDTSIKFDSTFEINMTDYQITPPEFMGMTVQDKVKVEAKGEAK